MWNCGFRIQSYNLKSIDLSSNNLTGEIPKEIGYLAGLVSLNLSQNYLSGEIHLEIGNLSSLESLDLSRNRISGGIPFSLSQIDDLGKLDLSHNSLSGRIPRERHFETFEGYSFEGNKDLFLVHMFVSGSLITFFYGPHFSYNIVTKFYSNAMITIIFLNSFWFTLEFTKI